MAEPKWPGGIAVKTEADAFHEHNGDVSLTGLSYVSLGDKGAPMLHASNRSQHAAATAPTAVTTSTEAAPAASQLQQQYHGYYHHQHQG
uniref:Uncharacterized protein n=1 Tax=Aegilops tauschii TaxID=37682 RepID=M8CSP9_AEGTA